VVSVAAGCWRLRRSVKLEARRRNPAAVDGPTEGDLQRWPHAGSLGWAYRNTCWQSKAAAQGDNMTTAAGAAHKKSQTCLRAARREAVSGQHSWRVMCSMGQCGMLLAVQHGPVRHAAGPLKWRGTVRSRLVSYTLAVVRSEGEVRKL